MVSFCLVCVHLKGYFQVRTNQQTKLKIGLTNSRKVSIFTDEKIKIKDFNNYSEAAEYLNCSIRTLSRYVDKNKLYKKNFYLFTKNTA